MSDPGYYFFPGDFNRDTMHLSIIEDGAYRRLLDHYYSTASPLMADMEMLYRVARAFTFDERVAVEHVVSQFFPLGSDGLRHNRRADAEIAKRKDYIAKQSELANRRWTIERDREKAKADAKAMRRQVPRHMPTDMPPYPLPLPNPILNPKIYLAPNVQMTKEEREKLVAKYGEEGTVWMIEKLDAAKAAKGYTYKSDAGAIRSWVVKEWEAHQKQQSEQRGGTTPIETKKVKAYTVCRVCGNAGNSRQVGICDDCHEKQK